MNNDEFKNEISDYIIREYEQFQRYQQISFSILKEFNRVASDNDIQYFLWEGSLLGAVRDRGQIPWDYDIDVAIKVDERDKLLKVLKERLSDSFFL